MSSRLPRRPGLNVRPGWLRLRGRRSTDSLREQGLLAQRITHDAVTVDVVVDARPRNYSQSAGLILHYNTSAYFYLRLSVREASLGSATESTPAHSTPDGPHTPEPDTVLERIVEVWERDALNGLLIHGSTTLPHEGPVRMKADLADGWLQFHVGAEGAALHPLGPRLDATHLSDDCGKTLRFTGPFAGICAQDLRDQEFSADFTDFSLCPGVNTAK